MKIDWGDVRPTSAQRRRAEAQLEGIEWDEAHGRFPAMSVERRGVGFAAHVRCASTEVSVRGPDLDTLVERVAETLAARPGPIKAPPIES